MNGEKDSAQKDIHTILSRIYYHISEILVIIKEDRTSLDEIAARLLALEKRVKALENEQKEGKHTRVRAWED